MTVNSNVVDESRGESFAVIIQGSSRFKHWSQKFLKFDFILKLWNTEGELLSSTKGSGKFPSKKEFDFGFCWNFEPVEKFDWKTNQTISVKCEISFEPTLIVIEPKLELGINAPALNSVDSQPIASTVGGNLCDLTIECLDGSLIEVHHRILEMSCPALQGAMRKPNQDHLTTIKFANTNPEAVKKAIRFIYTNKLDDIKGVEKDVIDLAHKLEIARLPEACHDKMWQNMRIDSVVDNLILAEETNFDLLRCLSIKFIISNFKEVREHETWKKLSKFPDLLMELFTNVKDLN